MLSPAWHLEVLRCTSYFVHWSKNRCGGCVLASCRNYLFYVRFISVKTLSQSSSIWTQGNKKMEAGKTLVINISPLSPLRIAQWGVAVKCSKKWSGTWKQNIFFFGLSWLIFIGSGRRVVTNLPFKIRHSFDNSEIKHLCCCYCFYLSHHPEWCQIKDKC